MPENLLISRIIKTELIAWRELRFIQQEDFKDMPAEAKAKLKASLLANQFTQPFYVWQNTLCKTIYCLDGKHRTIMLHEMLNEGIDVPTHLPATFIHCENKNEAARLVLIYSSVYAKITEQGLTDFIKLYDLDFEKIKMETSIFGLTDIPDINLPLPDFFTGDPKNKPVVMRITFQSPADLEEVKPGIESLLKESEKEFLISVSAGEI